jgi:hypothetical protein
MGSWFDDVIGRWKLGGEAWLGEVRTYWGHGFERCILFLVPSSASASWLL